MNFCIKCGSKIIKSSKYCTSCGNNTSFLEEGNFDVEKTSSIERSSSVIYKFFKFFLIVLGIIFFLIIISAIFSESENEDSSSVVVSKDDSSSQNNVFIDQYLTYNQDEIVAPVVNIYCSSIDPEIDGGGGSGTIISEDGMILTNSHIIPQNDENIFTEDEGCIVVLPDIETGQPKEIFLAQPIVLPELSDTYDLAFLEIYSAYYDDEEGYLGEYPQKFPAFDDSSRCSEELLKLGEPVRVFGYPEISGGYSLTVTDGVVSSFPGDGLIITSAKISNGNSGGLAVDRDGCMIGVPSMVSGDENESLGIIISADLISEFVDEVSKTIE